jgi:hypothetical protein
MAIGGAVGIRAAAIPVRVKAARRSANPSFERNRV